MANDGGNEGAKTGSTEGGLAAPIRHPIPWRDADF